MTKCCFKIRSAMCSEFVWSLPDVIPSNAPLRSHLCRGALVASVLEQVSHHIQVILLGSHVQRSESILQHTSKHKRLLINHKWWQNKNNNQKNRLYSLNQTPPGSHCSMSHTVGATVGDFGFYSISRVQRFTWDCALMSAPRLTRIFTTSAWPAREDMWSAVFPFWSKKKRRKKETEKKR